MAVVLTVVAAAVVVLMTVAAVMAILVDGPLVDTLLVWIKIMNVAVFVDVCLACAYYVGVGRYILLVLTVHVP